MLLSIIILRRVYKDCNELVIKFSYDMPSDLMLSALINRSSGGRCFTVAHVMCVCAFVSDVLKLNKDKKAECLRTTRIVYGKMVQKNKTVCKLYLDIVKRRWKF